MNVLNVLQAQEEEKKSNAATLLQRVVRRYREQKKYRMRVAAAILLQCVVRRYREQKKYRTRVAAATLLQRTVRCHLRREKELKEAIAAEIENFDEEAEVGELLGLSVDGGAKMVPVKRKSPRDLPAAAERLKRKREEDFEKLHAHLRKKPREL